ncbi:MAG TPA: putative glycoside hydrolase [Bacillota bacterium]|nr:putative glycoside hydrolase [Bacillota bacterium]
MKIIKNKYFFLAPLVLLIIFSTGITGINFEGPVSLAQADPGPPGPDQIVRGANGLYYGISGEFGFMVSTDAGNNWESRNEGLPQKMLYPYQSKQVRYLTALGVDPVNPRRVAVVTTTKLFLTEDQGVSWQEIPLKSPIPTWAYLTAVALSPLSPDTILIGTSAAGIFETKNKGQSWSTLSEYLAKFYQGAGIYEEIAGLVYHPQEKDQIVFALGFGEGIYSLNRRLKTLEKIKPAPPTPLSPDESLLATQSELPTVAPSPEPTAPPSIALSTPQENQPDPAEDSGLKLNLSDPGSEVITNLAYQLETTINPDTAPKEEWLLRIATRRGVCLYSSTAGCFFAGDQIQARVYLDPAKLERIQTASNKFALYLRWDFAVGKKYDNLLDMAQKNGLNAIVVDMKDDSGFVTYDTRLTLPKETKAARNFIKLEELLRKAKEKGFYVIGRVVVFQDPRLFRYQNNKYAVWDKSLNKAWSTKEYWVDSFCQEVWEYNLSIAEELQERGIDEVQFDYIRFPTDGNISQIKFRYRPEGMEKIDALESFLKMARERLHIPISTDLYGFNCWLRIENVNGQNMELFTKYVDVVCPMYYPSHFPRSFMPKVPYLDRAERIYQQGTFRAYTNAKERSLIRPYVQAFLLGAEYRFSGPERTKYLLNQLEGIFTSNTPPGYTLWNYPNKYDMVNSEFQKYMEKAKK